MCNADDLLYSELESSSQEVVYFVVLSIQVDVRQTPMCMSGAAVLKQTHYHFDRTESTSLIQTSLSDVFEAKPADTLEVL